MKNKKGFTLIELVAVVALLSIVGLVVVISVNKQLNNQEKRKYEIYRESILEAAELYVEPRRNMFPELSKLGDSTYITAKDIISANLLDSELENPKTNGPIDQNTRIKITVGKDNILIFELEE